MKSLECLGMDEVLPERLVGHLPRQARSRVFRRVVHGRQPGIRRLLGPIGRIPATGRISERWPSTSTTSRLPCAGRRRVLPAILPVDLTYHRRSCSKPKVGRIRAVLSWGVPPSTTNPDQLSHWGNRLDAHVQINPGEVITPGDPPSAKLRNLGGIPIEGHRHRHHRHDDAHRAIRPLPRTLADGLGRRVSVRRQCPGRGALLYLGYYYRLKVRKLTDPISSF